MLPWIWMLLLLLCGRNIGALVLHTCIVFSFRCQNPWRCCWLPGIAFFCLCYFNWCRRIAWLVAMYPSFKYFRYFQSGKGILVKSVGVVDANADTAFEVVMNIERSKRYEYVCFQNLSHGYSWTMFVCYFFLRTLDKKRWANTCFKEQIHMSHFVCLAACTSS